MRYSNFSECQPKTRGEEGLLPSHFLQGRNPEGQQKGKTSVWDITGGNESRCSEFPSAESVMRLSTQIKRIDVKKDKDVFFLPGIEEQENLHHFILDSDFWVKSPISKSLV